MYTQKDLGTPPLFVSRSATYEYNKKGNDMQRRTTGGSLLLIMPAFFTLLQVALAQHHQHIESYHEDKDSQYSFPTAFYPNHIKQETMASMTSDVLLPTPSSLWNLNPDYPKKPVTVLFAAPPQSRAPPYTLFS